MFVKDKTDQTELANISDNLKYDYVRHFYLGILDFRFSIFSVYVEIMWKFWDKE